MSSSYAFYGTSSSESSPPTSYEEAAGTRKNDVRAMLLRESHRMVLMEEKDGRWDLPLFIYKRGIQRGDRMLRLCRDFSRWICDKIHFTAVVELIGFFPVWDEGGCEGELKLVAIERADGDGVDDISLPNGAEWKNSEFLCGLVDQLSDEDERKVPMEIVLRCIKPDSMLLSSIPEPRHQYGWFKKASDFLESVVRSDGGVLQGRVVQMQMTYTSTILVGRSSQGRYFLKAPARGSNEVQLTAKITSLFPGQVPAVLRTSSELECFVTREFRCVEVEQREAIILLGKMQLESLSHIEELKESGCVIRDLKSVTAQIKLWAEGYRDKRLGGVHYLMGGTAGYLLYLCRRLAEFDIPLTLNHGDFHLGNNGYDPSESNNVILFDWEFACISHPFFDLCKCKKERSEEVILEYLKLWTDYGDLTTLKEVYRMASVVGRALRVWSLWERALLCEHHKIPGLKDWLRMEVSVMSSAAWEEESRDTEYPSSPEAQLFQEMKNRIRWVPRNPVDGRKSDAENVKT